MAQNSQRRGGVKHVRHFHQRLQQSVFHFRFVTNMLQQNSSLHQHFTQQQRIHSSIVKHQQNSKDRQSDIVFSQSRSQTFSTLTKNILRQQTQELRSALLLKYFSNKITEKSFRPLRLQVSNIQTVLYPAGIKPPTPLMSTVRTDASPQEKTTRVESRPVNHLLQKNVTIENHQKNEFAVLQKQLVEKIDTAFVTVKQEIHQENAITIVHQVKNQIMSRSGEIAQDVLRELQRSSRVESMRRGL